MRSTIAAGILGALAIGAGIVAVTRGEVDTESAARGTLTAQLESALSAKLEDAYAVDRHASQSITLGMLRLKFVGYVAPECDPAQAEKNMDRNGQALSRTICEAEARIPSEKRNALRAAVETFATIDGGGK